MIHLLYIGNKLKTKRSNLSTIHTLGSLLEKEGYQLTYASEKSNKILRLLDMVVTCLRHIRSADKVIIDVYSTHNFYFALLISQICRAFDMPYITNLNGGNLPMRLKADPRWSRLIFDHALYNVAPSKYLKDSFERYGYQRLVYIPNSIEIDQYPYLKKTFDSPRLLWVRSFSKIYNPLLAIKVLKALKDRGLDASLCMVGPDSDGTLQDVKEFAMELGVPVRFTGKLSKLEWIALSKDYNVFINTTHIDNTPVSVIEAMALGLPIVSTNVGGMPYLIEHNIQGLLVPTDDVTAMVNAILSLFDVPEQRGLMIANARHLAEQFDWKRVKDRWDGVLGGELVVSG